MVKSIFLQDGEEIFVDDEDYGRLNEHTWWKVFKDNTRYIKTEINGKPTLLQSYILTNSFQKIKNNSFTKDNLTIKGNKSRWVRARQNQTSKYKGVSWNNQQKMWFAKIQVEGKMKHLGRFNNEDDAAIAYNNAVLTYWDGDGYINLIGTDNRVESRSYKTNKHRQINRAGKSGYKGVQEVFEGNYWKAVIAFKNMIIHVLHTDDRHKAALAYNKCAIYLHNDEENLNDVPMTGELKEFISNWEIPEKIKKLKED